MNLFLFIFYLFIIYIIFDFIKKNFNILKSNLNNNNNSNNQVPIIKKLALPIIGHLYLLGERPNREITKLSKEYGGIYRLYMGDKSTLVITDVDALNEIWCGDKFKIFVNRPHHKSLEQFSGGFKNLSFSDYPLWSELRKLVSYAFTKTKLNSYRQLLKDQTLHLISSMNQYEIENKPFNPKKYIHKLSLNIICMIAFSKEINQFEEINKGDMARLTKPKEIIFKHLGSGNIGDFCNIFKILPLYYFKDKKYQNSLNDLKEYINEIYNDHLLNLDLNNPKDIMDYLIIETNAYDSGSDSEKYKEIIIQTSIDFLIAGSDTAGVMIEWFIVYMTNNQNIQEKVYQELIDAFGTKLDCIGYGDEWSNKTPYLNACIKEVLRIKPVTSMGLPRIANEDTTVSGYSIPKGTHLIQNIYGLSNSELLIENPNLFSPERWLIYQNKKEKQKQQQQQQQQHDDVHDQNDEKFKRSEFIKNHENKYFNDLDKLSIPFSLGRRSCVGLKLGESELYIACSNLIYNFKLQSFNGNPINELEDFGITIHPFPHELKLIKRNK